MKKLKLIFAIINILISNFTTLILLFHLIACGSIYDIGMRRTYSNIENFKQITSVDYGIDVIDETIYITINHNIQGFEDSFKISGKNYEIVVDAGLLDLINDPYTSYSYKTLTISSAPGHYSGGWSYPIAEVIIDGVTYLKFEVGQKNVVEEYGALSDNAIFITIIALTIMVISFILFFTLMVSYSKSKRLQINNIKFSKL